MKFSEDQLTALNEKFLDQRPQAVLEWALTRWQQQVVLASSFGPQSIVIAHLLSEITAQPRAFFIDTDLLFAETLQVKQKLEARLGLTYERVHSHLPIPEQAKTFGPMLWYKNSDRCCYLRKVAPLRAYLADKKAWITGRRREQSHTRQQLQCVEWDFGNGLVKLNPLVMWTKAQVWRYLFEHNLPYNTLHDQGYPSIGCMTCTAPVQANQSERAGRWATAEKTECGIHV